MPSKFPIYLHPSNHLSLNYVEIKYYPITLQDYDYHALKDFTLLDLPITSAEDTLPSDALRVTQSQSHKEQYVPARL